MDMQSLISPTSANDTEHMSFASEMAAEEKDYAALMAQAKVSLARIEELGVEIDKVRESQNTGEVRTTELLSQIGSFGGIDESGDHTMEGSDQVEATDRMQEEECHMEDNKMEEDTQMEIDTVEDGSFPELMERAKRLLARVTMNGEDQKTGHEAEAQAQARHDRAYADLWNPM